MGVKQINEIVEKWMEKHEPGHRRGGCKINNRLFMYPGFKFMVSAPFKPHKSLKPAGLNKRKPSAQTAIRKKMAAGDGETVYSETRNGQIEVVKSIRTIKVKGSAADSWVVECEPKGQCVKGAKLLINRRLHVDPSAIEPAWAITSNKSMGGECKNVCVYVPTTIGHSKFDRSTLYVALSRPIEWLGVVGRLNDISTLIMRDPRPVLSGLLLRLKTAIVTPPGQEEVGWDWKEKHDHEVNGMINEELLEQFADLYDQSSRTTYNRPTSLCALSWASFFASEELLLKGNLPAIKALEAYVKRVQARLYAHVENHSPLIEPPWERPGALPLLPAVRVEAELAVPMKMNEDDDDDDDEINALLPLEVQEDGMEPVVKKRREELSESL